MTKLEKYVKERDANKRSALAKMLKGKTLEIYNSSGFTMILDLDKKFLPIYDAADSWNQIILFSALMSVAEAEEEDDDEELESLSEYHGLEQARNYVGAFAKDEDYDAYIVEMCNNPLFRSEWWSAKNGGESFAAIHKYDAANGYVIRDRHEEAAVLPNGNYDLPDLGDFYGLMHTVEEILKDLGYKNEDEQ